MCPKATEQAIVYEYRQDYKPAQLRPPAEGCEW
jgi:hypothetical protein